MPLVCILISIVMLLSPISACAFELSDPIEPVPTFYGYEILGYDDFGNVILQKDDYLSYLDMVLSERAEGIANGTIQRDAKPVPFSAYSVSTYDLSDLNENKFTSKTRFINLPNWLEYALDAAIYMLEHPTMSAGTSVTMSERISSIGKKQIYYVRADVYEEITCSLNFDYTWQSCDVKFTRAGFGAVTQYTLYSSENSKVNLTWSADGYIFGSSSNSSSGIDPPIVGKQCRVGMKSYSVNSLPTSQVSMSTKAVENDASQIIGTSTYAPEYAENTFVTNSPTYNNSHYLVDASKKYWTPVTIYNSFPIKSGDVINQNNVSNYAEYGYSWNSTTNTIDFDPAVLAAYISGELLPQLELLYKEGYQKFPDVDADISDDDIIYENPFGDDDDDNLPDTTVPPGGVVGGGGMTPSELDGVLNGETFYILDMETGIPPVTLDTLPSVNLPAELSSGVVGVSNFAIDLLDSLGLLPVFVSLSVLAFIVFALKGG